MVYQEVMAGKRCTSSKDFVQIIEQKSNVIVIDELSKSDINHGRDSLRVLFDEVKPVPNIQKVHSMTVIDIDKIECKVYSNSTKKNNNEFLVHFLFLSCCIY